MISNRISGNCNNLASKETEHRDRLKRDALFNWVETAPKYPTQKGSVHLFDRRKRTQSPRIHTIACMKKRGGI